MEAMIVCGIDPGYTGAIAVLDSETDGGECFPMPRAGSEIDWLALAVIMRWVCPDIAAVERVHSMPGNGVVSSFRFGGAFEGINAVLQVLKIKCELVSPQTWKSSVLRDTPKDKDAAIAYCMRNYPGISLTPPGGRKPSHDFADALCIATYALREYGPSDAAA